MNCRDCGGLIMEPGKSYGYAWPVCYCGTFMHGDSVPYVQPSAPDKDKLAELERRIDHLENSLILLICKPKAIELAKDLFLEQFQWHGNGD